MLAQESRQGQDDLFDLAFDAMFARGFYNRVITFWNRGAEYLYGWTRDEAMGRDPAELLGSQYPIPIEEIEEQVKVTGQWDGEIRQRRKNGDPITVRARWGLQTDESGEPYAILEINSDLTREKILRHQLEMSEERFTLLVSAVVDYAIFMLDPEGRIATWNEGAQRIKGYQPGEIIGRHFSIFYPEEDIQRGKPQWELEVARQEGRYAEEGWRLRKDGTRFWASVTITATRNATGRLLGYVKVTRDLTERRLAEERRNADRDREAAQLLAHAQRMADLERAKSDFLNLASHELRGPLTAIRAYNSMIQVGLLTGDELTAAAGVIESKVVQINLLIEQMLETARLEDDGAGLKPSRFDLKEVCVEQVATYRRLTTRHDLQVHAPDRPLMVTADRARISVVMANLIDNAVKYSPNGGKIEVTVAHRDGCAMVTVKDQGVGIAPELVPQLFKRFGRLSTDDNITIPGTGLGLYLSQDIARRHGGVVELESVPGRGSEFTLKLPQSLHEAG